MPSTLFLFNVPVTKPRLCKLAFALLTGAGVVVACSVDDANMATSTCSGLNCSTQVEGPVDATDLPTRASGAPDAAAPPPAPPAKPECGVGSCLPEDLAACSDYSPPPEPGADAGSGIDAGANPGADAGADGGAEGPAVDGSFNQPTRPATGTPSFACQLSLNGSGGVERTCGVAGSQLVEQACTTSLDCAPGLGCVGPVRSGRCLPYCCGVDDADTCATGFYCAQRPLRSEAIGEADGPSVPVCVRADNCSLGEQKDCTGPRCVCGPEMACTLVRPDGTTSCSPLPEIRGQGGEPCPCDRGFHCSQATTPPTCVKTCDLDEQDSDTCGQGVCQAAAVLPVGWGICVAATAEQMKSE
jgi:hypothetical protein